MSGSHVDQNESEWSNPDNWAGPSSSVPMIYFSKRDSRLWVPKSPTWMGWTINFGHPWGMVWFMVLLSVGGFVPLVAALLAISLAR